MNSDFSNTEKSFEEYVNYDFDAGNIPARSKSRINRQKSKLINGKIKWSSFTDIYPWLTIDNNFPRCRICIAAVKNKKCPEIIDSSWSNRNITPDFSEYNHNQMENNNVNKEDDYNDILQSHCESHGHSIALTQFVNNNPEKLPIDKTTKTERIDFLELISTKDWLDLESAYTWLSYIDKSFRCSICERGFLADRKSIFPTPWSCPTRPNPTVESFITPTDRNPDDIVTKVRSRLEKHDSSVNHLKSMRKLNPGKEANKSTSATNNSPRKSLVITPPNVTTRTAGRKSLIDRNTVPFFLSDAVWESYKQEFSWIYCSKNQLRCSVCEDCYRNFSGEMMPTIWTNPADSLENDDFPNEAMINRMRSRQRLQRHENTKNHLLAVRLLGRKSINIVEKENQNQIDSEKPNDLVETKTGNLNPKPELFAPKTVRASRKSAPVKLTNLSFDGKNSIRRDKTDEKSIKTEIKSPSKSTNINVRVSKSNNPLIKESGSIPGFISRDQYASMKSRYSWFFCRDETQYGCAICLEAADLKPDLLSKTKFVSGLEKIGETTSYFKFRKRLYRHSESRTHMMASQIMKRVPTDQSSEIDNSMEIGSPDSRYTRLKTGRSSKIDYKRMSEGFLENHESDFSYGTAAAVAAEVAAASTVGRKRKEPSVTWMCPQCKSHFCNTTDLIQHITLCDYQSPDTDRILACPCNSASYRFNTITKLDLHAAQEHDNQTFFHCYICSDRYGRLSSLYHHMLIHHLINWDPFETYLPVDTSESFKCLFCSVNHQTNVLLTKHYCHSDCNKRLLVSVVLTNNVSPGQITEKHQNQPDQLQQQQTDIQEEVTVLDVEELPEDKPHVNYSQTKKSRHHNRISRNRPLRRFGPDKKTISKEISKKSKEIAKNSEESMVKSEDQSNKSNKVAKISEESPKKLVETSKLSDKNPERIDEIPKTSEEIPMITEEILKISEETPDKYDDPKMSEETPEILEETSNKSIGTPKKSEETPQKNEETPKKFEDTPKKSEETPKKFEDTPKKSEETPKKSDETPKKSEETPNKSTETPIKSEGTPKKSEEVQTNFEETPQKSETENANLAISIEDIIPMKTNESIVNSNNNAVENNVNNENKDIDKPTAIVPESSIESVLPKSNDDQLANHEQSKDLPMLKIDETPQVEQKRKSKPKLNFDPTPPPPKVRMKSRNKIKTVNKAGKSKLISSEKTVVTDVAKSNKKNIENNEKKQRRKRKMSKSTLEQPKVMELSQLVDLNEIITETETKSLLGQLPSNSYTHSKSDTLTSKKQLIRIQSQGSPSKKQKIVDPIRPDEYFPSGLSFMDRMKRIRQLKKNRAEQQREEMMAVDKKIAEINEKSKGSLSVNKSDKIRHLLSTSNQYSMEDINSIMHVKSKQPRKEKRKSSKVNVAVKNEAEQLPQSSPHYPISSQQSEISNNSNQRQPSKTETSSSVSGVQNSPSLLTRQEIFLCQVCQLKFKSLRARDSHTTAEHKGLKLFNCKVCDLSFTTHILLRKHAQKYHIDNVSLAVFGQESNESERIDFSFTCQTCRMQFTSRAGLNHHITSSHRVDTDQLNGSIAVDELLNKLILANPNSSPQSCLICQEIMDNEFELDIHTIEHEKECQTIETDPTQFACPKCCRLFFGRDGKSYLKDHYNIVHLEKQLPVCEDCDTKFTSTVCYSLHKKSVKNCAKKTSEQLKIDDPYEKLNDPMKLAFACSRCKTLVAGESAEERFETHKKECNPQAPSDDLLVANSTHSTECVDGQ